MSSTRRAKDDSVFRQDRYASSAEFERGLVAYLVAKRCSLVDNAADRELIWFIQYLSHQDGGLAALARELISKFSDRLQTEEMAKMKLKPGRVYNGKQVGALLEFFRGIGDLSEILDDDANYALRQENSKRESANYPADYFFKCCTDGATQNLDNYLREICLNPKTSMHCGPWYFPRLIESLREYKAWFIESRINGAVVTALGEKVCEVLDYTFYSRGLTLMDGLARLGKTHAARAWCEQHPGQARFVEVPPSNDESTFFRALARGLGLGNFLQYKVTEIRERVESVLLTGNLLLVLDEAHRLWPQKNLRYGFPSRINWVMAMANHKVPICAIATPQFIECQRAAEEKGQWNSAQLTGRITHYESLPADLSPDDLMAVAKSVLPEANGQVLKALAIYARSSSRYLAAIDSISKRAKFIALRSGRDLASTDDVRRAMQESVIPADTKLARALAVGKKAHAARHLVPVMPQSLQDSATSALSNVPRSNLARAGHTVLEAPAVPRQDKFDVPLIGA